MTDAVDVPKVGKVKRQYVIAAAALVAGIVGYAYYKQRQAAAAAAPVPAYSNGDVPTDAVTDTSGGAAGAAVGGSQSYTDTSALTTDAQWAQQAENLLAGAWDQATVAAALGAYLTHQPLTAQQQQVVQAAVGLLGYPPGGAYALGSGTGATPSSFQAPTGVHVSNVGSTSAVLTWQPVTGAAGYNVFRSDLTAGLAATGGDPVGDSGDTAWTAQGLEPGSTYSFTVAARDASGNIGPKSSPVSVHTAAQALKAPSGVHIISAGQTVLNVGWNAVPGAAGYRLYRSGVAQNVYETSGTSGQVGGLSPNHTYSVSVRAIDSHGNDGPESSRVSGRTKR